MTDTMKESADIQPEPPAEENKLPKLTDADARELGQLVQRAKNLYHAHGVTAVQAKKQMERLEADIDAIDRDFNTHIASIAKSHGIKLGETHEGKRVVFDQEALAFVLREV